MKQLTFIIVLLLTFSAIGQDTLMNKQVPNEENNWRLFPSKKTTTHNKVADTVHVDKKELDFNAPKGTVTVYQPEDINTITETLKENPYIYGYTVQLEVSQQTSKIRNARYKLLKIKPNAQLEESWLPPNTYLYAGSFYSRTDAYRFKHEIASHFPNATVISKKMKLPTLNVGE